MRTVILHGGWSALHCAARREVVNRLYCWQISHHTAPIQVRERCAFPTESARKEARIAAMQRPEIEGCMLISTCNRTEFYFSVAAEAGAEQLHQWVAEIVRMPALELRPVSRLLSGETVAKHLSRVASGMDSMILGEAQVFGQVRVAWKECCDADMADELLRRLVETAIHTARHVRSQTEIGVGAVSVPAVAARQYRKLFANPAELLAVIIGSGKMARLTAQRMAEEGIRQLVVVGRNADNVARLAEEVDAEAASLQELNEYLWRADILVGTSASVQPVVTAPLIRLALRRRRYKPQLLLDLAVPRDIAADVGNLSDAYLVNLDQLEEEVSEEFMRRQRAVTEAEALVTRGVENFSRSIVAMQAASLVAEYRSYAQGETQREFDRLCKLLTDASLDEETLERSLRALSRRLMHLPTLWLREAGDDSPASLLERFASLLARLDAGDVQDESEGNEN